MQNKILKLDVKSLDSLADIYIMQCNFGGIFIANEVDVDIGETVFLVINLIWINDSIAINTVVSYTSGASEYPPIGSAVSFGSDKISVEAKNKIENILGNQIKLNNILFS